MDGKGLLKVSSFTYEGSFRQGERHGRGKIAWTSGECYEG